MKIEQFQELLAAFEDEQFEINQSDDDYLLIIQISSKKGVYLHFLDDKIHFVPSSTHVDYTEPDFIRLVKEKTLSIFKDLKYWK